MEEEPQIDDQTITDDIIVVCNSLGKVDENDGKYMKDRDCKPCLRELLRHLNADSSKHTARLAFGSMNIIKSDLIPLIVQYCDYNDGDPEMFTTILRLCTNLTSSILLLYEKEDQEVITDPEHVKIRNRLLTSLYNYKEAFASDDKVWSTFNVYLRNYEDEEVNFERLIILIRNILHIPVDSTGDMGIHSDFDAHDMCLYRMDKSGMLDTLIKLSSESQRGMEFCFHISEIIYFMLRDQNAETLAQSKSELFKRKLDDQDADKKRLRELSAREKRAKHSKDSNNAMFRFRSGPLFVVQNCRSISDDPLLVSKLLPDRQVLKFDQGKTEVKKAKNKKPISSESSLAISDSNTKRSKASYGLKLFCKQFVEKTYNNYMVQIKYNLIQKRAQEDDETYYLWMIQFFTAFTRHMKLNLDHISETLSTSTLHYIQILITNHQDKLKMEKKKFHDISKRLHLALRAYREILYLIKSIGPDSEFAQTVKTIKRNIFTEVEYSSLLVSLFQQYNEPKHSELYLEDLIETNSVFLELLDSFNSELDDEKEKTEVEVEIETRPKKKKGKKFDYKTAGFMMRYCNPDVLRAHVYVLSKFRRNSDSVNLAILKFFERIAYDCKCENVLFQITLFKCLIDIVEYDSTLPGFERFKKLTLYLFSNFGGKANEKRWMFQDLLFWTMGEDGSNIMEPEREPTPEGGAEIPDELRLSPLVGAGTPPLSKDVDPIYEDDLESLLNFDPGSPSL